ncbi:LysM peptidoglycan-binding domain-containing protein [Leuconostoc mesenteroides]|uniref:LysM peptidoglycan-binding domain-containing protein n=1 Tax=Leuconostoc mesenteroides TaxID=1245 RepID=UPI000AAC3439|nr:LysM domain-containing protein [Leuconostoc mesenteroides]
MKNKTLGNKLFKSGKIIVAVAGISIISASAVMPALSTATADSRTFKYDNSAFNWVANDQKTVDKNIKSQGITSINDLSNYRVVWGDTLTVIANHFHTTPEELKNKFNIANVDFIVAGYELRNQSQFNNIGQSLLSSGKESGNTSTRGTYLNKNSNGSSFSGAPDSTRYLTQKIGSKAVIDSQQSKVRVVSNKGAADKAAADQAAADQAAADKAAADKAAADKAAADKAAADKAAADKAAADQAAADQAAADKAAADKAAADKAAADQAAADKAAADKAAADKAAADKAAADKAAADKAAADKAAADQAAADKAAADKAAADKAAADQAAADKAAADKAAADQAAADKAAADQAAADQAAADQAAADKAAADQAAADKAAADKAAADKAAADKAAADKAAADKAAADQAAADKAAADQAAADKAAADKAAADQAAADKAAADKAAADQAAADKAAADQAAADQAAADKAAADQAAADKAAADKAAADKAAADKAAADKAAADKAAADQAAADKAAADKAAADKAAADKAAADKAAADKAAADKAAADKAAADKAAADKAAADKAAADQAAADKAAADKAAADKAAADKAAADQAAAKVNMNLLASGTDTIGKYAQKLYVSFSGFESRPMTITGIKVLDGSGVTTVYTKEQLEDMGVNVNLASGQGLQGVHVDLPSQNSSKGWDTSNLTVSLDVQLANEQTSTVTTKVVPSPSSGSDDESSAPINMNLLASGTDTIGKYAQKLYISFSGFESRPMTIIGIKVLDGSGVTTVYTKEQLEDMGVNVNLASGQGLQGVRVDLPSQNSSKGWDTSNLTVSLDVQLANEQTSTVTTKVVPSPSSGSDDESSAPINMNLLASGTDTIGKYAQKLYVSFSGFESRPMTITGIKVLDGSGVTTVYTKEQLEDMGVNVNLASGQGLQGVHVDLPSQNSSKVWDTSNLTVSLNVQLANEQTSTVTTKVVPSPSSEEDSIPVITQNSVVYSNGDSFRSVGGVSTDYESFTMYSNSTTAWFTPYPSYTLKAFANKNGIITEFNADGSISNVYYNQAYDKSNLS